MAMSNIIGKTNNFAIFMRVVKSKWSSTGLR